MINKGGNNLPSTKLFKLFELSIGNYAVVEADENTSSFPFKVHGFINVIQVKDNSYYVFLRKDGSNDLMRSGEVNALKELAVKLTEEAVADEFGD